MVKKRLLLAFLAAMLFFLYTGSYAASYYSAPKANLGDVASNIVGVELVAHSFLRFLFMTCGVGLIASSVYHFKLWTQNRQHRPFSRPLLFLIFGLALIALVYIPVPI